MSSTRPPAGKIPLDDRSVLATVRGIPAWAAVLVAAGAMVVGYLIDRGSGAVGGGSFTLYAIACVTVVLAVRHRQLFTAMVQPPLLLFVSVPLATMAIRPRPAPGTPLKLRLVDVGYPLITHFPLMAAVTGSVLAVGLVRLWMRSKLVDRMKTDRATESPRTPTPSSRSAARDARSGETADAAPPPRPPAPQRSATPHSAPTPTPRPTFTRRPPAAPPRRRPAPHPQPDLGGYRVTDTGWTPPRTRRH